MESDKLTIGEVAKRVGLRPSALRYYESVGLLPKPQRVNGRRYYQPDVLPVLSVLQVARNAGFTIADLQTLFADFEADTPPAVRWRRLAETKMAALDAQLLQIQQMQQLLRLGLDCGCLRFEDCVLIEGLV